MIREKLLALQDQLREQGVLISFCGRFSQAIIEELGDAVKAYMETDDKAKNEIYNVFAIFIEQTQNIKNYCASKQHRDCWEKIANSGIVIIGKTDRGYFIGSGNMIENSDAERLAARLEYFAGLTKEELKKAYKEQLRREIPPGSTGAGIGMIDIARRATAPLQYSIVKLDNDFSFYTLNVNV